VLNRTRGYNITLYVLLFRHKHLEVGGTLPPTQKVMVFPSKFMLCLSMLMVVSQTAKVSTSGKGQARRLSETGRVVIYSRFDENLGDSSTSRKVFHDIN